MVRPPLREVAAAAVFVQPHQRGERQQVQRPVGDDDQALRSRDVALDRPQQGTVERRAAREKSLARLGPRTRGREEEPETLDVAPQSVRDVIGYLREEDEEPWERLMSLHGVDYLPAEPRFGIHYELLSMERSDRLNVRTRVGVEDPHVPTVVDDDRTWIAVDTSGGHACAIATGGALWCWGANHAGQVGDGTAWVPQLVEVP